MQEEGQSGRQAATSDPSSFLPPLSSRRQVIPTRANDPGPTDGPESEEGGTVQEEGQQRSGCRGVRDPTFPPSSFLIPLTGR
jgi:hypothetical protein